MRATYLPTSTATRLLRASTHPPAPRSNWGTSGAEYDSPTGRSLYRWSHAILDFCKLQSLRADAAGFLRDDVLSLSVGIAPPTPPETPPPAKMLPPPRKRPPTRASPEADRAAAADVDEAFGVNRMPETKRVKVAIAE